MPLVDAAPAMEHVRELVRKGMAVPHIKKAAGVHDRIVRSFADGYMVRGGVRRPVTLCQQATVDKVLAVKFVASWSPEGFVPEKLQRLREDAGLSRKALGEAAGLNESTIVWWENGRSQPTRERNIMAVLAVLEAGWEDVCGPVEPDEEDLYSESFRFNAEADYISDYPCCVCRRVFRSRSLLATHQHPNRKKPQ